MDRQLSTVKIIIIGDASVGKSNILLRYTKNEYDDANKPTIGIEWAFKIVEHDGVKVKLQIWDTAGQERFRAITDQYYKGAAGIVIVYDLAARKSYESVGNWLSEVRRCVESEEVPIILVGNKKDLVDERVITVEEAETYASENAMFYFETSAKENTDGKIEEVFAVLTENIVAKKKREMEEKEEEIVRHHRKTFNLQKAKRDAEKAEEEKNAKKKGCEC